jgi:hypothetical protein
MAGYVAILEAPVIPVRASLSGVASTQQSALGIQTRAEAVDQDEVILSDSVAAAPRLDKASPSPVTTQVTQVDPDERIFCDTENVSSTASESGSQGEPKVE